MSKKKPTAGDEEQLKEWEKTHTPGHPAASEKAWSVDSEYGEISFANFDSAYAYANGLSLGDYHRKIIDKDRKLIEVWLTPDHGDNLQLAKKTQAEAAGLPC